MTNKEAIGDIEGNIIPVVGGKSLRIACNALRAQEKEPCECGCDVCNRNFSGNGLMRVRGGTYLVLREIRDIVDAKYCPMCGRLLKGEGNDDA